MENLKIIVAKVFKKVSTGKFNFMVMDIKNSSKCGSLYFNNNIPVIAALLVLIAHLLGNPHYGFFRDELYFIICGFHPDWGYVDQPPLVPLLAAGSQLFGHSLFLLRAIPAICAAISVYISCLIVIELKGGNFAQILAAVAVFFCPVLMGITVILCTDTIGVVTWPLVGLLMLRMTRGDNPRLWIIIGLVLGIAFQAKYSIVFFAVALLIGLAFTPQKRYLDSRWVIVGAILGLVIVLPNILWQAHFNFPMLQLLQNDQVHKNIILTPGQYILSQLALTGQFMAVIWIIGLGFFWHNLKTRFLVIMFLVLIGLMILFHGKGYYTNGVYPILIAGGAVAIELCIVKWKLVRFFAIFLVILDGLFLCLPYAMPVLPVPIFIKYNQVKSQVYYKISPVFYSSDVTKTENTPEGVLPQTYADMHGWSELTDKVAEVVATLPASERERVVIVADNYGEAAALQFFGEKYHLPPVMSFHNQYYLWGLKSTNNGDILININGDCGLYHSAILVGKLSYNPYVRPFENQIPIMICRGIKTPLPEFWIKHGPAYN